MNSISEAEAFLAGEDAVHPALFVGLRSGVRSIHLYSCQSPPPNWRWGADRGRAARREVGGQVNIGGRSGHEHPNPEDADWQEVARYVHLNPVRVARLGLDKQQQAGARQRIGCAPSPELLGRRLEVLREWRWSSYPGYAGYRTPLAWVTRLPLAQLCGGQTEPEQKRALRQYTEAPLRQGTLERPWDRLVAGLVLGTEAFVQRLRRETLGNREEQTELRRLGGGVKWEQIVRGLEQARGEKWDEFRDRHGNWGRDAALWLGRKRARMSLRDLGQAVGGVAYGSIAQAVTRFGRRLEADAALRRAVEQVKIVITTV